jgi:hypothetical protein
MEGQLAWTNAMNTSAFYLMEWPSKPGGLWHSFTCQPINTIDAHTNISFAVAAPIFYRVVMITNVNPALELHPAYYDGVISSTSPLGGFSANGHACMTWGDFLSGGGMGTVTMPMSRGGPRGPVGISNGSH